MLGKAIWGLALGALLGGCDWGAGGDGDGGGYLSRPLQDEVFYFVMPDRFANGDAGNDLGGPPGSIAHGGFDPTNKAFHHGGDMQGLLGKLDYLQGLGVTAIWMTPLLVNQAVQNGSSSYHGYWTVDFTAIDPHFGTDADLQALIAAAHSRGMKVFFDIIVNHTADVIRYRACHDEAGAYLEPWECPYLSKAELAAGKSLTPFLPAGLEDVKRPAWLNELRWYNNQGNSVWEGESILYGDFSGLDDLNTGLPEIVPRLVGVFTDLVDKFRPDGFRVDTARHVEVGFWQAFAPAVQRHAQAAGIPNFTMFGESWYLDPGELSIYVREARLPGVLDFPLQEALKQVLVDGAPASVLAALLAEDDRYSQGRDLGPELLTFTGNHDMGRIGWFLMEGEATADAGAEEWLARAMLAHSFIFMARGVPVIYYGDEQGFTGDGGDQDARENMFPSQVDIYNDNLLLGTRATTAEDNFDPSHPMYRHLRGLADLRAALPALGRGLQTLRPHESDGRTLALSRLYAAEGPAHDLLALFNFGNESTSVSLPAWGARYEVRYAPALAPSPRVRAGELQMELPPLSAVLLQGADPLPEPALPASANAVARVEEHLDIPHLVVDYTLAGNPAPDAPLRVSTRLLAPAAESAVTVDLSPPWRAIFPLPQMNADSAQVELTLDRFGEASRRVRLVVTIPKG